MPDASPPRRGAQPRLPHPPGRAHRQLPPHPGAGEQELRTIQVYTDAVRLLAACCREHDQPLLADELTRDHIRDFIADQLAHCSRRPPTSATGRCTASSGGRSKKKSAKSPMTGMRPSHLPEQPVSTVRAEHLVRL